MIQRGENAVKLFVDDSRTPPAHGFECAEDYEGAIFLLKYMTFDFITLDYDLGNGMTGLDILKFICESKRYPQHINIHSDHSEGRWLMKKYADDNLPPNVRITMNPL